MLHRFLFIFLLVGCTSFAYGDKLPTVFNGKNLEGWKAPDGNKVWFTAEDGVLNVQNGPDRKGQTLWTAKKYKNFVMEFEFKMGKGTVDTGIYMRNDRDQIQIGISGSLKIDMTGLPYIPGKGYPHKDNVAVNKAKNAVLKPKDWNSMTIVAKGNNYSVWLNNKFIMSYESESAIKEGPVGIQLHGNREMSCQYRKIQLAELN